MDSTKAQAYTLRKITDGVEDVDKALTELIATATRAQATLRAGGRVPGMFSVLGQDPTKIERAAAHLNTLLDTARLVGLDDEQVSAAYADGTKAWNER